MIEQIYFQILEYVIAPIGLIIFTFYVKGENINNNWAKQKNILSENPIENLFIVSYSHLLYYLSIVAHDSRHSCLNEQLSALLAAVFGLLLLFVFKYNQERTKDGELKQLNRIVNGSTIALLFFLFFIIVCCGFKVHGFYFTFRKNDIFDNFANLGIFLLQLNNLIFIPFIILVFYFIIKARVVLNPIVESFEEASITTDSEKSINEFISISENNNAPNEIRISSFVHLAAYYLKNKKESQALNAIISAKNLAKFMNYPEHQLIGIRQLKIEIHCSLGQDDLAQKEFEELEYNKTLANNENRPFYDLWIKKLKDTLDLYERNKI